jgi:hypothetical protein
MYWILVFMKITILYLEVVTIDKNSDHSITSAVKTCNTTASIVRTNVVVVNEEIVERAPSRNHRFLRLQRIVHRYLGIASAAPPGPRLVVEARLRGLLAAVGHLDLHLVAFRKFSWNRDSEVLAPNQTTVSHNRFYTRARCLIP